MTSRDVTVDKKDGPQKTELSRQESGSGRRDGRERVQQYLKSWDMRDIFSSSLEKRVFWVVMCCCNSMYAETQRATD
jgi:hypothetical protein